MFRPALADLHAVIAVNRRGSFRAAAIDVGMSTTAFSHAIARLEAGLGVRLFNRTTRSVSLTDAGRRFVDDIGGALVDIDSAIDAVRDQRDSPTGLLRINVAANAAQELLSPLVIEFLRLYPEMEVDIVTEGRIVDIIAEGFDLGVRVEGLVPRDMIAVPLGRPLRFAVVGSPHYLERNGVPASPADLAHHQCIRVRLPNGALYRWQFERDGEKVEIEVGGRITLDEGNLSRTAAIAGLGLSFLHEHFVLSDIAEGRLVRVLDSWTPPRPGLALYYPSRRNPSAGLTAFLTLARRLASDRRDGTAAAGQTGS